MRYRRMHSLLLGLVVFSVANAQGTDDQWPGTFKRSGHSIKKIVFVVNTSQEEPMFKGLKYSGKFFKFRETAWQGNSLVFSWNGGASYLPCKLVQVDGALFRGECSTGYPDYTIEMSLQIPADDEQQGGEAVEVDNSGHQDSGENSDDE